MIDNFNLTLLAGGSTRVTAAWSRRCDAFDRCYKLYLPVEGSALVETAAGSFQIAPGSLFLIPGHHLLRQRCVREMLVHWVHFIPDSYYLHHQLHRLQTVQAWPLSPLPWITPCLQRIAEIFDESDADHHNPLRPNPPLELVCRIKSILMYLLADLFQENSLLMGAGVDLDLIRLKPAIDYMDNHYRENPSLVTVAGMAHLAPVYFHRLFKRHTGSTPFDYMEGRRLNEARRLLCDGRMKIKQVAEQSGYKCPLYFSRAFHRRFGMAPSTFQQTAASLS